VVSEELVSGVVIGDAGALVGGRVKLGANGTWHAITKVVKMRTDEGHEVELVDLERATMDPVVTQKADWRDLETEPGAFACVDEAPAPDVTAELYSSHVRGGQRIAAWGEVREHVLDGGSGGAYRESAKRRVIVMAPSMVFVGDNCIERLERLRATPAHTPLRPPPRSAPAETPVVSTEASPWGELRAEPVGLVAMVPVIVLFGILWAVRTGANPSAALVIIGAALALPLASQGLGYGFIDEEVKPNMASRAVAMLFAGMLGVTCVLALWGYSSVPAFDNLCIVGAGGGVALLAFCIALVVMSRKRRRYLRLVVDAPLHSDPIVDGVWGALEGTATADGEVLVDGQRCIVAYGIAYAAEDSESVRLSQISFHVGDVQVRIRGMLWFSTISRDVKSRLGKLSVDLIRDGARVRVVGRVKDGVIAKGGEQSLLVFATDRDGAPLAAAKRIARWDLVALVMACVGIAGVVAGIVLAVQSFVG
jgi:hypothetical protein